MIAAVRSTAHVLRVVAELLTPDRAQCPICGERVGGSGAAHVSFDHTREEISAHARTKGLHT